MVLSDLDIGMNDWMVPDFEWDESYEHDRGKVLSPKSSTRWSRSIVTSTVDGDGIPYRTLPGVIQRVRTSRAARAIRSTARIPRSASAYQDVVDRLLVKWETARTIVPEPGDRVLQVQQGGDPDSSAAAMAPCKEALDRLSAQNIGLNYCRVKAFPFSDSVKEFIDKHDSRLRRRAESRCAVAHAADPGPRKYRPGQAGADAALQRHAAQSGLRSWKQGNSQTWTGDQFQGARSMSFIRQTESYPPEPAREQAGPDARDPTKAPFDACAPVVDTIRSRRRLSRLCSSSTSSRT